MRSAIASAVCILALTLGGCGGSSRTNPRAAEIKTALHQLRAEIEHSRTKPGLPTKDVLGLITLIGDTPPRGVSAAEWRAAVEKDQALQHLLASRANQGPIEHPPLGQGATAISIEPPPSVIRADGRQLAEYKVGRTVAAQSGCLACHRIGEAGNTGPGLDLTEVAARIPRVAIARTLVHATPPMPSFTRMPPTKLRAHVELRSLLP